MPEKLRDLPDGIFAGCAKLIIDKLPPALKTIGKEAFSDCALLGKADLPDTLISIGDKAFYNCDRFNLSVIPTGVAKIGAYAFANTMLERVNLIGRAKPMSLKVKARPGDTVLTKAKNAGISVGRFFKTSWWGILHTLNSKQRLYHEIRPYEYGLVENAEIGEGAFSGCKILREIHLGKIASLGTNAFSNSVVRIYVEFNEPVPGGWKPDWNGDGFGKKMPYYKKVGRGPSYKLMK